MPEDKPITNDQLRGLLDALLGGNPAAPDQAQNAGQSLDQLLGNMASPTNATADDQSAGSSFGDLLGTMMGSAPQGANAPTTGAGSDPLGSILGGLLSGGMPQGGAQTQDAMSGDPMSAILGGLLGGGMQGGSGAGALGNNSFLAPIVRAIAAKIGISPQIAEAVVSFALTQLMSGDGNQLAQLLGGQGTVSKKYLRDSGLVSQLAQQTGMDNKTATKSLQQVLQAFGTQMGEGTLDDRQRSLQSWLETK